MSGKTGSADEKRAAANEARREGKAPSEVEATTGSSKQTKHVPKQDREPKGDAKT